MTHRHLGLMDGVMNVKKYKIQGPTDSQTLDH